jgi:GAF domain-containing protein
VPRRTGNDEPVEASKQERTPAELESQADAFQRLLDFAIEITGAEVGAIVLSDMRDPMVVAVEDATGFVFLKPEELLSDAVVSEVLRDERPVCIARVPRPSGIARAIVSSRLRAVLCIPLKSGQRVVGVIYLGKRTVGARFAETHLHDVTLAAGMVMPLAERLRRSAPAPKVSMDGSDEHTHPVLGDLRRPLALARDTFVAQYALAVLALHGGRREAASAALGVSLRSLYRYVSRAGHLRDAK